MNKSKLITLLVLFGGLFNQLSAQEIKAPRGFDPQVGAVVSMMEDLKRRVTNSVVNLEVAEVDFLLDEEANRIGCLIMHLAAVEKYYQVITFENRGFNREEQAQWGPALDLGQHSRERYVGQPISYYLEIWEEVRAESLRLLKDVDDKWLKKKVEDSNMNNHWAWYHVMEHQANHMGQIRLIIKRFPE